VVFLPFIGLAMFFKWVWTKVTGSAREGARDLAATVTPGWRPGEVHMTGRPLDRKSEELPAGGAGESALSQVADEVARKRRENGND
jgi:preprotein translocase subunit SecY